MAGSLKWFVYTTDAGTDFAINLDESNTEQVNGATQDYVAGIAIQYSLPRNVTPRYAVYSTADRTRTIKCVALTQTIYGGIITNKTSITDPIGGQQTLNLVRLVPEKIRRLPVAFDTGLDDGDNT
jgi:hypothetical protein